MNYICSALHPNWGCLSIFGCIKFLIITLTLILLPLAPALAEPSCEELNRLWLTKYHKEFKALWYRQRFTCDDYNNNADYRIAKAIYYLDHLKRVENGKEVGFNYYDYVAGPNSPLRSIQKTSDKVTSTHKYNIYLGQNFLLGPGDPAFLAAKLVHERRHMDGPDPNGSNHRHVVCTRGHSKGQKGCDPTFRMGQRQHGAFNYSMAYLMFVRMKANTEARKNLSDDYLNSHINGLMYNRFIDITKRDIQDIHDIIGFGGVNN